MRDELLDGHDMPKEAPAQVYAGYIRRKWLVVAALGVCTLAVAAWSLSTGSIELSPLQVLFALAGQGDAMSIAVVWNMRLPRVACALIAGCALALAGCAYQSVLRNPLASASTLGIAQGAAFGASIALIVLAGGGAASAYEGTSSADPASTALCAFVGAMLSTLVILCLSRFREMTPESIVLLGVALSALFTAGTTLVQYFADDSQVAAVVFWTFGDLSRATSSQLLLMAAMTAAEALFFHLMRWNFTAIEAGEGLAHGVGVPVARTRLAAMVVASAASSCVIAFCGVINFIGLVAPHIMRRFVGSDYRFLLPASALMGALLLLLADIVCHMVVAPLILPISAITSMIGAPIFIYLLFRGVSR